MEIRTEDIARLAERLELATKSARIAIWEFNLLTGELIWDDQMFAIYGVRRETFDGAYTAWQNGLHPDDMKRAEQDVNDAIAGVKEFDTDFRVIWPDKTVHDIKAYASVIRDNDGLPLRMVGVNWDITEDKALDRLKREFVSTVSHELRTPLTSIKGSLGLLPSMLGDIPDKAQKMLDIAYVNTERLELLIDDILDVEKIESGEMPLDIQQVDIAQFLGIAAMANQAYANQYNAKFDIKSYGDTLSISGDKNRLMQALTNLMSNAAKFSADGSTVTIGRTLENGYVRIFVTDRGNGIAEEFRDKVFDKFSQEDASDKRLASGTGLGLSITKAIVERHDGTVSFDTVTGQGTTFYIDLPYLSA